MSFGNGSGPAVKSARGSVSRPPDYLKLIANATTERLLLHNSHVFPVVLQLVTAVEANNIVPRGSGGRIPLSVHGATDGLRSRSRKWLRDLAVRTTDRQ